MKVLRAVIFDLDFTLADSTAAVVECARAGFDYAGLPCPSEEEIVRNIGMSFQEFSARHAGDLAKKVIEGFHEVSHRLEWVNTTFLLPGAREVLAEIKAREFLIGLATQKTRPALEGMLEYLDIARFFDAAIAGDSVPRRKPAPDALLECARRMNTTVQEAIYVGDHPYDILAAQAAGMKIAALATGPTTAEELAELKPDWLLHSLPELLNLPELYKDGISSCPL